MQENKNSFSIAEVINYLEDFFPPYYQEHFDNSGLQLGNASQMVANGLVCLDLTPAVMKEAIEMGANLIITHHPLLFNPLKKITGTSVCEKLVIDAIQNNIAVYSMHTNLDNLPQGVNKVFAQIIY